VTVLLDANALIALLVDDHVHHAAAKDWFAGLTENFAACPITQGSLLCLLIREASEPPRRGRCAPGLPLTHGMSSGPTASPTPMCQSRESWAPAGH
jgi:PIN domain